MKKVFIVGLIVGLFVSGVFAGTLLDSIISSMRAIDNVGDTLRTKIERYNNGKFEGYDVDAGVKALVIVDSVALWNDLCDKMGELSEDMQNFADTKSITVNPE